MQVAAVAREVLLRQNVFHPHDATSSPLKTYSLAHGVRLLHAACLRALEAGTTVDGSAFNEVRRALDALRESEEGGVESSLAAVQALTESIAATRAPRVDARPGREAA
jgi:vacuolar-type H+-ATPase catalytic subunit A/Vma1